MTPKDIEILARTLYGEARGEPWEGKLAVAWVIRNRVDMDLHNDDKPDWWGETYVGVCMAPWQFSCWNRNDPNLKKIEKVGPSDFLFRDCLAAAAAVVSGLVRDPTDGATHYFNPDVVSAPKWALSAKETTVIGRHTFFKDVK